MWKDIQGYEGYYKINEYGDVINSKGNIIKPYISNKGYKIIDLCKKGTTKKMLVHRLVAIHFVPNPNNDPIVLHLDNVKTNTYYSNLKWGTYSENNAQAVRDGLHSVPTPDNRKYYQLYNSDNYILCFGVNDIIDKVGFGNDSSIRNYIFRDSPIPKGEYAGYHIRKLDMVKPFTINNL